MNSGVNVWYSTYIQLDCSCYDSFRGGLTVSEWDGGVGGPVAGLDGMVISRSGFHPLECPKGKSHSGSIQSQYSMP